MFFSSNTPLGAPIITYVIVPIPASFLNLDNRSLLVQIPHQQFVTKPMRCQALGFAARRARQAHGAMEGFNSAAQHDETGGGANLPAKP